MLGAQPLESFGSVCMSVCAEGSRLPMYRYGSSSQSSFLISHGKVFNFAPEFFLNYLIWNCLRKRRVISFHVLAGWYRSRGAGGGWPVYPATIVVRAVGGRGSFWSQGEGRMRVAWDI